MTGAELDLLHKRMDGVWNLWLEAASAGQATKARECREMWLALHDRTVVR